MKKFSSFDEYINYCFDKPNPFSFLGTSIGSLLLFALSPLYIVYTAIKFVVVAFFNDFFENGDTEKKEVTD